MSEYYYYGLSAMIYITTCWVYAVIRWFHTCNVPKERCAYILVYNNILFSRYKVYLQARQLVALCYVVFAIGFLLHAHFEWRTSWPAAASALSVSYFHIGGVLFGWSHTSLMRPDYLTRRVIARDLIILIIGLAAYWTAAAARLSICNLQFSIFFAHASMIVYTFYRTYFQMRRNVMLMPTDGNSPHWWTPEVKRTVLNGHHSFMISCYLIVIFGIGSIVVTAAFPHQTAPYTVLLCMGVAVYCYIFYSLAAYGNVIDAATWAIENVYDTE